MREVPDRLRQASDLDTTLSAILGTWYHAHPLQPVLNFWSVSRERHQNLCTIALGPPAKDLNLQTLCLFGSPYRDSNFQPLGLFGSRYRELNLQPLGLFGSPYRDSNLQPLGLFGSPCEREWESNPGWNWSCLIIIHWWNSSSALKFTVSVLLMQGSKVWVQNL